MASSVPSAVSALISISEAALGPDVLVWFGKPLSMYQTPVTLQIVGVHSGEQEIMTMGPDYKREEHYQIQCQLTSFAGDPDFTGRMSEVFDVFQQVTIAIGNNPTLNGSVRFAEIGTFEYVPDSDSKGMTLGALTFTVACQARISSLT